MNKLSRSNKGFGALGVLAIIVVLIVVGGAGAYVWHRDHKAKTTNNNSTRNSDTSTSTRTNSSSSTTADPYAGWKTYCDTTTSSCIKYPADWSPVPSFTGAFENTSNTTYVSLTTGTTKDAGADMAYIYSIDSLSTSSGSLDIIGYVVNNKPTYTVFDASYTSANNLKVGMTAQLADRNYAFEGRTGNISLVATPGATGYASITSLTQAKAWFTGTEAQTDLLALKSFYYQ